DHGARGRQAQAEAGELGRHPVKSRTQLVQVLGRDTGPVVSHGDAGGVVFPPCVHLDTRTGTRILEGVVDQINDSTGQQVRVGLNGDVVRPAFQLDPRLSGHGFV